MALGKNTVLQRLGDQRKRLVLAGLAAGAVAAAALKRKKGGEETEFGKAVPIPQAPEPAPTSTAVESGPPAVAEVPPAASKPDVPDQPMTGSAATLAANESPSSTAPAAVDPSPAVSAPSSGSASAEAEEPATSSSPAEADAQAPAAAQESAAPATEPATGELSAEEASILAVLAQSGRIDDDRTAIAVATSLERETTDVAAVLRKLSAEGVVSGELYTAAGDKIWAVTERGVRRLGAQS